MIHSFNVANFYSFRDEIEVDFTVDGNAPDSLAFATTASGVRFAKSLIAIGPNASGKTNLMKVIPFIKWLIVDSDTQKPDDALLFMPFLFGDYKDKPTTASVVFEIDGDVYTYVATVTSSRFLEESLKKTSIVTERKTTKELFMRKWQEGKGEYSVETKDDFGQYSKDLASRLGERQNASVFGMLQRDGDEVATKILKYWSTKIRFNVGESGHYQDALGYSKIGALFNALEFYEQNPDIKVAALGLLKRFDFSASGFNFSKITNKEEKVINIDASMTHAVGGQSVQIPIHYESAGTKQMLVVLAPMFMVLKSGGTIVIDELDINLHPDIVVALHEYFIDPVNNPHNAQILFTAHTHILLQELDKRQILLVERNEKTGSSEMWKLSDMDGEFGRNDNYYMKYIAGAYGARPYIS